MADGGRDGERKVKVLSPRTSLPESGAVISMLFDTSDREQCEVLHKLRAFLQEYSDIEALNEDLFVLHIYAGALQELSS